jgi:hypothetical protein
VRHTPVVVTRRRHAAGRPQGVLPATCRGLFHHAHAGRYFGGLWFKVFSERGPC